MSTSSVSASDSRKSRPRVTSSHFAGLNSSASMDGSFLSSIANLFLAIKKPPRRTACAAVGFAPTSPQSRALLVLCYFPCFLFSHMSVTLSTMARSSGVSLAAPFAESGSSPRVRGTLEHNRGWPAGMGIIPACAGNTSLVNQIVLVQWDHPRVCGEHDGVWRRGHTVPGSSPRMRGTLRRRDGVRGVRGIIPAYAGNTIGWYAPDLRLRDHPRVCGEHCVRQPRDYQGQGSSPRMRGTLENGDLFEVEVGIIPAYAGNTGRRYSLPCPCRDHPRVCGEHRRTHGQSAQKLGSSPRVRGTRKRCRAQQRP